MTRAPNWTDPEDDELRRVYPKGGLTACRRRLPERPRDAIRERVKRLHLHKAQTHNKPGPKPRDESETKTRACLKCREPFPSEWAGERVCRGCKSQRFWGAALQTPVSSGGRVAGVGRGL